MSVRIRCGIVGLGFIGPHHMEAMRRLPNVDIVAVASRNPDKIRDAARRFGIPRVFSRYEDLVTAEEIDVVDVATPTVSHHPIALAAIAGGKHVIVDKPLALNLTQAQEMVDAARRQQVVHAVTFNYRYYPLVQQARAMVQAQELGELHLIRGHYLQDWLLYPDDFSWRLDPEQSGEGAMIADAGSHWFDLVEYVTGLRIESVLADVTTVMKIRLKPTEEVQAFQTAAGPKEPYPVRVPDLGSVLLRFSNGALGHFVTSPLCAGRENDLAFELFGNRTSLSWRQEEPNVLIQGRRDSPNQIISKNPAMLAPEARRYCSLPGGHNEAWPDAFKNVLANIFDFIESGKPVAESKGFDFPTFESGLRTLQIVQALLTSARDGGRWTKVDA